MNYFYNKDKDFDNEMYKLKNILEDKGFVLESDHPYAYAMQYDEAYDDVVEWLNRNDYNGKVKKIGGFYGVAIYALNDTDRITYEEMNIELEKEVKRQI